MTLSEAPTTIGRNLMTVSQAAEPFKVAVRAPASRTAQRAARRWEAIQGYGFLFPALLLLLLFHVVPVFYALFLSLFDARVFRDMWAPGPFIGAGNYGRLLTSSEFGQSLANTVWFAGITVPLGLFLAVFFAQLLNARIWGRTGYRVTYFLPYVTSTVAAAVVWRWIFQPRVGGAKVVTIYLYQQGFKSFNLGYAAAIGMLLFVIIFVLTLVQFRATRSRVVYAD